jgi:hypothetical protein
MRSFMESSYTTLAARAHAVGAKENRPEVEASGRVMQCSVT